MFTFDYMFLCNIPQIIREISFKISIKDEVERITRQLWSQHFLIILLYWRNILNSTEISFCALTLALKIPQLNFCLYSKLSFKWIFPKTSSNKTFSSQLCFRITPIKLLRKQYGVIDSIILGRSYFVKLKKYVV